jgi:acetate kinase
MRILVVNSGSSSLKLRVLDDEDHVAAHADLPPVERAGEKEVRSALLAFGPFDAVGHRVVHGGRSYTEPARIDAHVRGELERLTPLAPLHQPAALHAIDIVSRVAPDVPAVACFDTAFFARLPPNAATYAVPREWRDELGVRKYGFHGLAHASTSRRAAHLLDERASPTRIVTCHLGAGASLAAVVDGRCVDTTMGFTPLDGLVMATRSGAIDPGLVLWLQQHAGIAASEIGDALERRSGLIGLAGTPDMRAVLGRAAAGDPDAVLAREVYLHRLRAGIAAMVAAAEGLDALVFSGGVGEHSPEIRQRAARGLRFLDVTVDDEPNVTTVPDCEITGSGRVRVFVVAAREDLEIARAVRSTLAQTLN